MKAITVKDYNSNEADAVEDTEDGRNQNHPIQVNFCFYI